MQLGRVIGTVVATEKADGLDGVRFLIVQPLAQGLRETFVPVDHAIVGIVDAVEELR
jgi:ethanolamine utilization protein EutN